MVVESLCSFYREQRTWVLRRRRSYEATTLLIGSNEPGYSGGGAATKLLTTSAASCIASSRCLPVVAEPPSDGAPQLVDAPHPGGVELRRLVVALLEHELALVPSEAL